MAADKPADSEENNAPAYTPGQQSILKFLRWGAWTAAFIAMMYVMHF
jgi:hypothetical protein